MKFLSVHPRHTNVLRILIVITDIGSCASGKASQSWTATRGMLYDCGTRFHLAGRLRMV